MNSDLELALKMADTADAISMARYRALDLQVETKPDFTPVTEADRAVETALRTALDIDRPADAIIGEEFPATNEGASRTWIIDPIDATKNYVRGVPVWGTLISLVIDNEPIVGVVSAPAMGRRWWSSPEDGAFTKDVDGSVREISPSKVKSLSDASFSYSDAVGWDLLGKESLQKITSVVWRTRAYGDFWSHLLVAEGAVDIAAEPSLALWDMAAVAIVVKEAGGRFSDLENNDGPFGKSGVSTNGHLHEIFIKAINS